MKRIRASLLLALLTTSTLAYGQPSATPDADAQADKKKQRTETPINFGAKGGFTASLFLVSDLSINGTQVEQVQNNYKIGYFASMFMRINFDRHFLQPELSYTINRCNITFDKPMPIDNVPEGTLPEQGSITSSIHSIEVPVIYGYNIIKDGPYSLAVFGGPKLRYIWDKKSKVTFENFNMDNIREELYPFNASASFLTFATTSACTTSLRKSLTTCPISSLRPTKTSLTNKYASLARTMYSVSRSACFFKRNDVYISFYLLIFVDLIKKELLIYYRNT